MEIKVKYNEIICQEMFNPNAAYFEALIHIINDYTLKLLQAQLLLILKPMIK
jgi:hypothetical protein